MRLIILAFALFIGGCQPKASADQDDPSSMDEWPAWAKELTKCLEKHQEFSKCIEMGPQQRMRGVWFAGFEESGFIPDVDSVEFARDVEGSRAEFQTFLEIDTQAALKSIGVPEIERCTRAVAIQFIGRRSVKPGAYYSGYNDHVIVVDQLLSAKLLGRIRTRGVPGYDEQCATPAPSELQQKAMDEADWKRCEAAGQCSTYKLEKLSKPKN